MIKKTITYTDLFTEEEKTVDCYFHLSESELLAMQVKDGGQLVDSLQKSAENKDAEAMLNLIKEMILVSYGEKGDNGSFYKVKNGVAVRENFEASPAFDTLMMRLTTDPVEGKDFILGIMPSGIRKNISEEDMKAIMEGADPKMLESFKK